MHGAAAAAYCSVRLRSHSKVAIRITNRVKHSIDKTLLTALKYNICCILSTTNVVFGDNSLNRKGGAEMAYYPRLRDLREDADLTQDQLVKILGMHKTTYTNYEQGKREPPFELIIRLAKLYRVSIDYIAGLTPYPAPLRSRK